MLYKYRSIDNFKNIVDIFLKNRLYAAKYFDLNEPMEGHYIYSSKMSSKEIVERIKNRKKQLRIVSLSRSYNNFLMWSHYADGHRGIVIGVEVNKERYNVKNVNYVDTLTSLDANSNEFVNEFAERILTQKLSLWKYEEEERVVIEGTSTYVDAIVKQVIIGKKMSTQNYSLIKELINKINPDIEVIKIETLDPNFDYNVEEE